MRRRFEVVEQYGEVEGSVAGVTGCYQARHKMISLGKNFDICHTHVGQTALKPTWELSFATQTVDEPGIITLR
jgi:hypothetical protein